jgi:hypothetical protein
MKVRTATQCSGSGDDDGGQHHQHQNFHHNDEINNDDEDNGSNKMRNAKMQKRAETNVSLVLKLMINSSEM